MKKLILLISILLLTGCQDYIEINDFAIISGIILDYQENEFQMTSELIINEEETKIKVFKTQGKTIDECLSQISTQSNKDIFISHLKILIITEDIIKNNINIYDYFLRSSKSKMNFDIYLIKKENIDKIFEINKSESSSEYIEKIMEYNNKIYSSSTKLSFIDLVYKRLEPNLDPLYPNITVKDDNIILDNLSFINNNETINLSTENSIYYNMLINNVDKTILNLKCEQKDYSLLTKDIKTKQKWNKDTKEFIYNVTIKSTVNNYECNNTLDNEEQVNNLNTISNEQIKKNIEELINISTTNNYDFLGIVNYINKRDQTNKQSLKDINIKINVKTEITSIGEIRQ